MDIFITIAKHITRNNPLAWGLLSLAGLVIYIRIKNKFEINYLKRKLDDMEKEFKQRTEDQDKKIIGAMHEYNDGFRNCHDFSFRGLESVNNRLFKLTEQVSKILGKNEGKGL